MREDQKEAKEKKFMLGLFAKKKSKKWIPGEAAVLNKDLTMRQRRGVSVQKFIPSTVNNHYQLYNSYKLSVGRDGLSSTSCRKRSTDLSALSKAKNHIDSILVA